MRNYKEIANVLGTGLCILSHVHSFL